MGSAALTMWLWIAVALALVAALFTAAPRSADAQAGPAVVISEFVASNQSGPVDNTGEYTDWIELHNTSGSSVNLNGWTISAGGDTHTFSGLNVSSGEYVVIFASGDTTRSIAGELHLGFKLSVDGESLVLADSTGTPSTPSWPGTYPAQQPDISYGIDTTGGLFFFDPPTPGEANGDALAGIVEPVSFSVDHGFYDTAQRVVLTTTTPSATIRYTTDGSTPSVSNGTAVASGTAITINQTTVLRAAASRSGWITSASETRSYLYPADIVQQSESAPAGWPTNLEVNNMPTFYGLDANMTAAQRNAVEASLTQMPTISITTDLDNLFDPSIGIWTNPQERGSEWERPVAVELIDPTGAEPGFEINGGLRVKGNSSRRLDNFKHSMRLVFNNDYGDGELNYPVHGTDRVDVFESLDLRTEQSWSWSHRAAPLVGRGTAATWLRDVWNRDAQGAMGHLNTESKFVHAFINGQYWGLYMTEERVANQYASQYLGGNESDYDVIDQGALRDGNFDAWLSLWPMVQDHTLDDAEWARFQDEVDVENLIDYYLLTWLSGDNTSSPRWSLDYSNNWLAVRNRTGVGAGGKWKFVDKDSESALCTNVHPDRQPDWNPTPPWNLDASLDGEVPDEERLAPAWLLEAALTRPEFVQVFKDRVELHILTPGGALTVAESIARLDARVPIVDIAIDGEAARWGDTWAEPGFGRADWEPAVQAVRDCFAFRTPLFEQFLREDGLWPLTEPPVVSPASGEVAAGTPVSVTADVGAAIWVTTDGSDPLGTDGQPAAAAFLYSGEFAVNQTTVVKARVLAGDEWSPIVSSTFTVPTPARIILNEWNAVSSDKFLKNGGSDSALGTVLGNGGDWFELVVIEDELDIRGWTLEISDADNDAGVQQVTDVFEFAAMFRLKALRAGTIITVSEDFADDGSYDPAGGDWTLNLQANSDDAGRFFTASQSNFSVNNQDWQLTIRDKAGAIVFGPAGEGIGASGVGSNEIGELEADPTSAVTASVGYDDGDSSTFGEPNGFDGRIQDFGAIRPDFGDNSEPDTEIAAPLTGAVVDNSNVTISGTATDNVGVDSVRVAVKNRDTGLWLHADGTFATGSQFMYATLDSPGATSTGWTLPVPLPEARWFVVARAEDVVGNRDTTTPFARFDVVAPIVDNTEPDTEIAAPLTGAVVDNSNVTISGTATDNVGVDSVRVAVKNRDTGLWLHADGSFATGSQFMYATLDNPGGTSIEWTLPVSLPDARWFVVARAEDAVGNRDTTTPFARFDVVAPIVDTENPNGAIDAPVFSEVLDGPTVTLTGTATDDVAVDRVRLVIRDLDSRLLLQADGTFASTTSLVLATLSNPNAPATSWSFTADLPAGEYALTVDVRDPSNKPDETRARVGRFTVVADTTNPDTAITSPTLGDNVVAGAFTATGVASDNVGVTAVRVSVRDVNTKLWLQADGTLGTFTFINAALDSPSAQSTTWALPLSAPPGDYEITARAVDAIGNTDTTKPRVSFTVE